MTPLSSLKIVVDPDIPENELHVHAGIFDVLRRALDEAGMARGLDPVPPPPTSPLCIFAGTVQEARHHAQSNGLQPGEWWYPHDARDMVGRRREYRFVHVGTWYLRKDCSSITRELRIAGAVQA